MTIYTSAADARPRPDARLAARTVPPQAYFAGSAVFHYLGPSFAVLLFARVDVLGVAWLRIASAAVVLRAVAPALAAAARARPRGTRLIVAASAPCSPA